MKIGSNQIPEGNEIPVHKLSWLKVAISISFEIISIMS
jgi:hypothetical protein